MTHLLIFVSKKSENFEEVLSNVKGSAQKNKGKVSDWLVAIITQKIDYSLQLFRFCLCW